MGRLIAKITTVVYLVLFSTSTLAQTQSAAIHFIRRRISPIVLSDVSPTANPLVATYTLTCLYGGNVMVEFGTGPGYDRQTAAYSVDPGTSVAILVAGMKPATQYHMRARLFADDGSSWTDRDHAFTTGAIDPSKLPRVIVTRTASPALQASENPGIELIAYQPANKASMIYAFVTDRDGNPIWYYETSIFPQFFKLMPNGHILIAFAPDGLTVTFIREVDLAGNTIRELDFGTLQQKLQQAGYASNFLSFSHDFIPMPNGHLIVIGQSSMDFTDLAGYPGTITVNGDVLVDLDANWDPVWFWSAFDHLDVNRHLMGLPDWTHGNAVVYNPTDGNLLLSMRHQSWIVNIDYRDGAGSGEVLWRLGKDGDFRLDADPSQWFYAQHFPNILQTNGPILTLAVFDNGNGRISGDPEVSCGNRSDPECYSRPAIFLVDLSSMSAEIVWQYLPGFFSFWGGAINRFSNGNVEFDMSEPFPLPAPGARIQEVTQTNPPEIIWQMDLPDGFSYRTYRIPSLYPGVVWP